MQIIKASYILTCNEKFEIFKDKAICFDKNILDIDSFEHLKEKYPSATCEILDKNSVLLPGLINPHVHLEFSANKTTLKYGDFLTWLNSVIKNREDLISKCTTEIIQNELKKIYKSGTTTIGAVSSNGLDFEACLNSPLRVVFFTELLGSRPDAVDVFFGDFKSRLRMTEDNQSEKLIPAISVHAPYSTHPILAKNALDIARKFNYPVSTHFMESVAERNWLDNGTGEFCSFFENFAPNIRPMSNSFEYLKLFENTKTLFTHCVQANEDELKYIKQLNGYITHCPVSNRALGVGKLDLEKIKTANIDLTLGTDGLSSNISLNLWDEMRATLLTHESEELNSFAQNLLVYATKNSANALSINAGEIKKDTLADIIVCELPEFVECEEELALQLILHTKNTISTFIGGEKL